MNETCGCCEGITALTPLATANRPGLDVLRYRVGTHASFLETMKARLSSLCFELPADALPTPGALTADTRAPLDGLTTRDPGDPAIALLDAWATVADVLTFYQERIANEGYLRTAIERRSILELARLVGYTLRPGVSADVYLAYILLADTTPTALPGLPPGGALATPLPQSQATEVVIPAGSRAQTVPGPGEKMQSFETAEDLVARAAWNNLRPRLTRPQAITLQPGPANGPSVIVADRGDLYVDGLAANLKANDPLIFVFGDDQGKNPQPMPAGSGLFMRRVAAVTAQAEANRTRLALQTVPTPAPANPTTVIPALSFARAPVGDGEVGDGQAALARVLSQTVNQLELAPSVPPANARRLQRDVTQTFALESDLVPQLLLAMNRRLQPGLYASVANTTVESHPRGAPRFQAVEAMRVKAAPFGHNAPLKLVYDDQGRVTGSQEWPIAGTTTFGLRLFASGRATTVSVLAATSGAGEGDQTEQSSALAQVIVVQNGVRRSQTAPLDLRLQAAAQTRTQTMQLGQARVELTIQLPALPPEGGRPGPTILSFVYLLGGEKHELRLVPNNRDQSVAVTIDGLFWGTLSAGQSVRGARDDRAVSIIISAAPELSEPGLTITLEAFDPATQPNVVALDAQYDQIVPGSYVVIERTDAAPPRQFAYTVQATRVVSRAAYGISGKVTEVTLAPLSGQAPWLTDADRSLAALRNTTIYAQSEPLTLAEEPIPDVGDNGQPGRVTGDTIELDGVYAELKAGRWLIVSGERADIEGTSGVQGSELVMLAAVSQGLSASNDRLHTTLKLAAPLAYRYKLATVTINGNAVRATHGETRAEVLGSGDSAKALQTFALRQPPLTYLPAPTPEGAASTLEVRVNDLLWHAADNLAELGPAERRYIIRTEDDGKTSVVFGNGISGARPPTGVENITARYRSGIGKPGNARAGQISLLATKPLGVQSVVNPLPATGGVDAESRDQARRNVPLALLALDHLVSTPDYADFARRYAGIGKAVAARLSDGRRQLVHVTVAAAGDAPLDERSALLRNLRQALYDNGDPALPVRVAPAVVDLLVVKANVRVAADYLWEKVEAKLRAALLDAFSFERRDLGQDVLLSEVLSVMLAVAGVADVEVEIMDTLNEQTIRSILAAASAGGGQGPPPTGATDGGPPRVDLVSGLHLHTRIPVALPSMGRTGIEPAHLAFLSPDVPDTLILTERANARQG